MRPGVRSARSGSKSLAGTTVEAHIARPRARGRATRLRAFPQLSRPDSIAQTMTVVRNAG